ncbi:MAG: hypothetical protein LBN42_04560 [Oscillospiraceae bacterium]|jgi:hypothetical protein|nr:hypothetical protein [Oscillospiraceae bacterium]
MRKFKGFRQALSATLASAVLLGSVLYAPITDKYDDSVLTANADIVTVLQSFGGYPDLTGAKISKSSFANKPILKDEISIGKFLLYSAFNGEYDIQFNVPTDLCVVDNKIDQTIIQKSWALAEAYYPFYNSIQFGASSDGKGNITWRIVLTVDSDEFLTGEIQFAKDYVKNHPVPAGGFTFQTEKEYLKGIHDTIINGTTYGSAKFTNFVGKTDRHGSFAYCALVEGESVCAGYAKAMMLIAAYAGINVAYQGGYSDENDPGSAHAWNLIYPVDGSAPKLIDVTWDDPVYVDANGNPTGENGLTYDYFYIELPDVRNTPGLEHRIADEFNQDFIDSLNPNAGTPGENPVTTEATEPTTTTAEPTTTTSAATTTTEGTITTDGSSAPVSTAPTTLEPKDDPYEITDAFIAMPAVYTFTNSPVKPEPKLTLNGYELVLGTDYTVIYFNNKELGTATARITGIGNFTGEADIYFQIIRLVPKLYDINEATVVTFGATGEAVILYSQEHSIILIEDTDYIKFTQVSDSGSKWLIIIGIGNYNGMKYIKVREKIVA